MRETYGEEHVGTHLASLLTKSPNPGVSTTVRRRRTPSSSISAVVSKSVQKRTGARTCANALDSDGFRTLGAGRDGLLGWIERGVEEGINEGRLAKARLA